MKKIVTVIGARPQFVKSAVISRLIALESNLNEIVIHTGQHHDKQMSDVFFSEFNMSPPDYFLNINGISHGAMTGMMVQEVEKILLSEKPDMLVVYGDTNSTLAGALAASKLKIPVAHVESGLRSFNRSMPEEINRILTDHISTLLFCSTLTSVENLANENINRGVFHVGDIMYDAILSRDTSLRDLKENDTPYGILTVHRAESTASDERLRELLDFVHHYACNNGLNILFPVHPRIKDRLDKWKGDYSSFSLLPPQGYFDFHHLASHAEVIFTDSGGLQKEAYFHRVPCITLRDETEWVETIECGWNHLWKNIDTVVPRKDITEYGTGVTGQSIVDIIKQFVF